MVQPWKTVCQTLKKPDTLPSNDIPIAFLGNYPRAMKTYVYTKIYTWMFMAALFVIAQNRKQPRCT